VTRATIIPAITPRVAPPQTAFGPFQCNTKRIPAIIAIIVVACIHSSLFVYYITIIFHNLVFKRGVSPSFFFFPLSFEGEGDTGGEVETKRDCFASLAMTRGEGG